MRTIVVGSRHVSTYDDLLDAVEEAQFTPSSITSSITRWGDKLAEKYAREHNLKIHRVKLRPILNAEYSRDFELIRNSDAMIILYSGMSHDTKHLFELAQEFHLTIFRWNVRLIS